MRLHHYWASGGIVEFDSETGDVTPRLKQASESVNWGSAWKQRGRWFGLWHDGTSLVFQHGGSQWKLTADVVLRVNGSFWRTFQIARQGNVEFQFSYRFRGAIIAAIDPTYDTLDEEADDFFLYVTRMWEYWKDRGSDEFGRSTSEANSYDL